MPEETSTSPSAPEPTAEQLLDALIDILIRDRDYTSRWHEAISTEIQNPRRASSAFYEIIFTGAELGVPKRVTYKIIEKIAEEDGISLGNHRISAWMEAIYGDRARVNENRRRRQDRLPPLP